MIVRYITIDPVEYQYGDLTPGREYKVLSIEDGFVRISNDKAEPILYPVGYFHRVDDSIPPTWVIHDDPWDGGFWGPAEFRVPGFLEDYFDGKKEAIEIYNRLLKNL